MSKQKDSLAGFGLMDQVPEVVTETKPTSETEEELSTEEIAALDAVGEAQAKASDKEDVEDKSSKKEEEPTEEVESKEADVEEPSSETENKEEVAEEEESEDEVNTFQSFANFLSDAGVYDIDEDTKIESEQDLITLQNKQISEGIDSYKKNIPEDGQKFLEFLDHGGRPEDFHKHYYNDVSFESFDIESEANQKYVVRESLKLEGYSEEEINDELEDFADLNKLDKKASIHLKKLQKLEVVQKSTLLDSQKAYDKEQEAKRVKEWGDFESGLFDTEEIGGFKFSKKMKNDLWSYMTSKDKTGKTQYLKDSEDNNDATYMMAYLLKNKWNLDSLEKTVKSKVTSNFKAKLNRFTDTRNKMKSGAKTKREQPPSSSSLDGFKDLKF